MIHLFLNGLAASAGGGLTYLRNVVPHLSHHGGVQTTLAASPALLGELGELPNVSLLKVNLVPAAARRLWQEQLLLPDLIRRSGADVLISAGNFALRSSPVPQILLSRNSLYTSADFYHDLRSRGEHRLWLDTRIKGWLARRSIHWADRTVAPSRAFAEELRRWTGKDIAAIHHGFDPELFFCDQSPLPAKVQEQLDAAGGALRLLFVSHYNYYRNFETLLRALPGLQKRLDGRAVKLFLTCKLEPGENPGSYRTETAARLVHDLGIRTQVVELGAVPYRLLHHLYRACDLYVTPAYTETFAHPLVEAMACGLPVVASDLPVHREICGDAALYFPRFGADELASSVARAGDVSVAEQMSRCGRRRARRFSWGKHVDQLLTTLGEMLEKSDGANATRKG